VVVGSSPVSFPIAGSTLCQLEQCALELAIAQVLGHVNLFTGKGIEIGVKYARDDVD
jgi:hypothetical protein